MLKKFVLLFSYLGKKVLLNNIRKQTDYITPKTRPKFYKIKIHIQEWQAKEEYDFYSYYLYF